MELELLDWLLWFALIPAGTALIFGGVMFLWLRHVVLTRTRVWLVTLGLTLLFVAVELFVIFHFAYLLPD